MKTLNFRYDRVKDINVYEGPSKKYIQLSNIIHYYGLNSQESVGSISYLMRQKEFKNIKDWRDYYIRTGEESFEGRKNGTLNKAHYGRTQEELRELIQTLYDNIQKDKGLINNHYPLLDTATLEECHNHLVFLILGHSWNGMAIRENNVIAFLQRESYLDTYTFEQSEPIMDLKYGIDIVVKEDGKIVGGLQVKPMKYLYNNMKVSDYALEQLANFKSKYGARTAIYVYADDYGRLKDDTVLAI